MFGLRVRHPARSLAPRPRRVALCAVSTVSPARSRGRLRSASSACGARRLFEGGGDLTGLQRGLLIDSTRLARVKEARPSKSSQKTGEMSRCRRKRQACSGFPRTSRIRRADPGSSSDADPGADVATGPGLVRSGALGTPDIQDPVSRPRRASASEPSADPPRPVVPCPASPASRPAAHGAAGAAPRPASRPAVRRRARSGASSTAPAASPAPRRRPSPAAATRSWPPRIASTSSARTAAGPSTRADCSSRSIRRASSRTRSSRSSSRSSGRCASATCARSPAISCGRWCTSASSVIYGAEYAARYRVWRRFQNQDTKPLILLLGGTSGVGKSSLAIEVARRLSIARVLSTDAIRDVMRVMISEESRADAPRVVLRGPSEARDGGGAGARPDRRGLPRPVAHGLGRRSRGDRAGDRRGDEYGDRRREPGPRPLRSGGLGQPGPRRPDARGGRGSRVAPGPYRRPGPRPRRADLRALPRAASTRSCGSRRRCSSAPGPSRSR